ncbi:MAG: hypothetical protein R3B84_13795 [Zavarzinella sp.]
MMLSANEFLKMTVHDQVGAEIPLRSLVTRRTLFIFMRHIQ